MDTAVQEQLVSLIDTEIAEIARCAPPRADALDALLDLRLRVLETAAFEWIEREVSIHARRRRRLARVPGAASPTGRSE